MIITLKYVFVLWWDVNSNFWGQKEAFSFDSLKVNIL